MCIAVYKPKGKAITKKVLAACWKNNSDGGGLMFANEKKLWIGREVKSFRAFWKMYQGIKPLEKKVVLHFRIATSGQTNIANCHPFAITKDLAFCHNGILDIKVPDKSPISDTLIFRNEVLKNLPDGFHLNKALMELVNGYIGWSKMIFLDSEDNVVIANESKGEWTEGVWYSNGTYKEYTYAQYEPLYAKDKDGTELKCRKCSSLLFPYEHRDYVDLCRSCHEGIGTVLVESCATCGLTLESHEKDLCDLCKEDLKKFVGTCDLCGHGIMQWEENLHGGVCNTCMVKQEQALEERLAKGDGEDNYGTCKYCCQALTEKDSTVYVDTCRECALKNHKAHKDILEK